ncbi:MAG: hypothetical protein ACXWJ0_06810 [Xanthobacteraceae bacterium]
MKQYFEILGYAGAALMIATLAMRTMIPLRIVGIITNCLSLTYGSPPASSRW